MYFITLLRELNVNVESILIKFNFGIKKMQIVKAIKNKVISKVFDVSAELNPPESISVIAYAFSEFVRIKNAIMELAKILIDNPIRINLEIENFENPLKHITKIDVSKAPINPNRE